MARLLEDNRGRATVNMQQIHMHGDRRGGSKWTALHRVCGHDPRRTFEEQGKMIELLLNAGADCSLKDSSRHTPRDRICDSVAPGEAMEAFAVFEQAASSAMVARSAIGDGLAALAFDVPAYPGGRWAAGSFVARTEGCEG
jgi:hypothetical protein